MVDKKNGIEGGRGRLIWLVESKSNGNATGTNENEKIKGSGPKISFSHPFSASVLSADRSVFGEKMAVRVGARQSKRRID